MENKNIESISVLIKEDMELETIGILLNSLKRKFYITNMENDYEKAQLDMIRKINNGRMIRLPLYAI